ncbi:glycosyltransferase family 39 protein [Kaistia granuli]|uniref:glycosyltransferase family 39 protein n=1 Tax=Kaistia granuli TaxID=363259 RepID=UPI000380E480|nr:glycosyltransferase family 39 protein [Kaistia granuli]
MAEAEIILRAGSAAWRSKAAAAAPAIVFVLTFSLCLVIRLSTLGELALWFDEVITADVARASWSGLVADRLANGHFPTYFALLKGLGLAGGSEFALRLPSALLDSLAGALVALLALRLSGRVGAIAAALLYAFYPALIQYGQEARPYALMLAFVALAITGQIGLLTGRPKPGRQAILATIGTLGAALSIPAGIVPVALQHLALPACGFRNFAPALKRLWWRHILITWTGIVVAAAFLLPAVQAQAEKPVGLMKWQSRYGYGQRAIEAFGETYGFVVPRDLDRFLDAGWNGWLATGFLALMLAGFLANRAKPAHRMLAVTAFGTPLVFLVLGIFSASAGRYLIGMLPAAVLLASAGIAALVARPGVARLPALAVLVALLAGIALQALDMLVSARKYDWRPVAAFLRESGVRDAEILTDAPHAEKALRYYLPDADRMTYAAIDPVREPMAILWDEAAGRPLAFLLTAAYRTVPSALAEGAIVCSWRFGDQKLTMIARDAGLAPAALKRCEAES